MGLGSRREERRLDLPLPSVDDKVVQGKDGWLFLANDSNDTLGPARRASGC